MKENESECFLKTVYIPHMRNTRACTVKCIFFARWVGDIWISCYYKHIEQQFYYVSYFAKHIVKFLLYTLTGIHFATAVNLELYDFNRKLCLLVTELDCVISFTT